MSESTNPKLSVERDISKFSQHANDDWNVTHVQDSENARVLIFGGLNRFAESLFSVTDQEVISNEDDHSYASGQIAVNQEQVNAESVGLFEVSLLEDAPAKDTSEIIATKASSRGLFDDTFETGDQGDASDRRATNKPQRLFEPKKTTDLFDIPRVSPEAQLRNVPVSKDSFMKTKWSELKDRIRGAKNNTKKRIIAIGAASLLLASGSVLASNYFSDDNQEDARDISATFDDYSKTTVETIVETTAVTTAPSTTSTTILDTIQSEVADVTPPNVVATAPAILSQSSIDTSTSNKIDYFDQNNEDAAILESSSRIVKVNKGDSISKISIKEVFGEQGLDENGRVDSVIADNPILKAIMLQSIEEIKTINMLSSNPDTIYAGQVMDVAWSSDFQAKANKGREAFERLKANR